MKRCLILLLVLCLALPLYACAEEEAPEAQETPERAAELFDLWNYGAESMAWITSLIPAADGVLIAARSALPEKQDQLAVSDGASVWEVKAVLPDSSGLLAMILYDTEEALPRYGSWPVLTFGESVNAASCIVRFGDELGSRINRQVLSASAMTWKDNRCFLLSLSGSADVGSPVLTADGRLAGIIAAEYAEGQNRYVMLGTEEIIRSVVELSAQLTNVTGWGNPPEGFHVSVDRNQVTIDWKDMALPEKKTGEKLYLVVLDAANDYLNYYPAETETKTLSLLLTPGRTYLCGITASVNPPADVPEAYKTVFLPRADRLTAHHFSSQVCAVAEGPESGVSEENPPVPVAEVTEELLRSGRAYFYSSSTYEVDETLPNESLLITLTDPNGNNYQYESLWLYAPEYMKEDIWYLSLADTGLTSALDMYGYPQGVYQMAFYVNGELGDTLTFELR